METFSILRQILSSPFAILIAVFFFGASIFVHELGHFLAARWRGLKIERFSIGMGPRLFGWTDKHGVEWRISALPLGGYVLLPQLSDLRGLEGESEHTAESLPKLSYTDKMTVAVAGAVFNVIFAFVLASVLWMTGRPTPVELTTNVVGAAPAEIFVDDESTVPAPAYAAGVRPGDRIIAVDGEPVDDFDAIRMAIVAGSGQTETGDPQATLSLERGGEPLDLTVFPVRVDRGGYRTIGIGPASPLEVGYVFEDSPAALAGLQEGDRILEANGETLYGAGRLSTIIAEAPEKPVVIKILRDGVESTRTLTAEEVVVTTAGSTRPMIGVGWARVYANERINPFSQVGEIITLTVDTIAALLNPRTDVGLSSMSGPLGILSVLHITAQQGILVLLWLVILINVNLAVMNLLPLPILDGGHMAFATWQKLTGRPVPVRVIASLQGAMMFLLLGMVLYVSFFDVLRISDNARAELQAEEAAEQRVEPVFGQSPPPVADENES